MPERRLGGLEWPYIWTAALFTGRQAEWVFRLDFMTLGVLMGTQAYVVLSMALSVLFLLGLMALASGRRAGCWWGLGLAGTAGCISVYDGLAVLECYRAPGCNALRIMPMSPFIVVATLVSASILMWRSIRVALTKARP